MAATDGGGGADGNRRRIVEAAYACMARDGIATATVEGIARQAGLSRATVYRAFPGGRDDLASAAVEAGVTQFLAGLRADIGDAPDLATMLERALVAGRHRLDEHAVLQRALRDEPDQIVPLLATVLPLVLGVLRADIGERLGHERLRPGVVPDEAADLLARLVVSTIGNAGSWDTDDPVAVRRLVRDHLLAGVVAR